MRPGWRWGRTCRAKRWPAAIDLPSVRKVRFDEGDREARQIVYLNSHIADLVCELCTGAVSVGFGKRAEGRVDQESRRMTFRRQNLLGEDKAIGRAALWSHSFA